MICVPNANMMLALGTSVFHLKREGQKVPRNFHQFLTNGKNKEILIAFLFSILLIWWMPQSLGIQTCSLLMLTPATFCKTEVPQSQCLTSLNSTETIRKRIPECFFMHFTPQEPLRQSKSLAQTLMSFFYLCHAYTESRADFIYYHRVHSII